MNESGQFLLAKQVLTPYVQYFVAVVPAIKFTRIRPKARLMNKETATHYAVYLRQCGEEVILVFNCKQVSSVARLSGPMNAVKSKLAERGSMYSRLKQFFTIALCALLVFAAVPAQAATVTSNTATIAVSFNQSEFLNVAASGALTIPAGGGESNIETVTVSGLLSAGHPTLDVVAYFSSASALTGTAGTVTASNVQLYQGGSVTGAFTSTWDGQSNAFLLAEFTTQISAGGNVSFPMSFGVGISPAGMAGLIPGAVAGTLNVFAQAN